VWSSADPRERFWASRTVLYHGAHVTAGASLHSTWPGERPLLTIVEDSIRLRRSPRGGTQHDITLGRCSQAYREKRYGVATPGCQELLADAIAPFGLAPSDVHDALNLFMITGIDADDRPFFEVADADEADYVLFEAQIDCLVAISACPGACTAPDAVGLVCELRSSA
jgi:uncharacterized protein YcgI (DUF1989 family)